MWLQAHCKRHPNNYSWFPRERVIFSFSSQAFGLTPISTGPWPQMSVPGDIVANDVPRGTPQSAACTLFSILQSSNHCHIHNSYTSDLEVYYNPLSNSESMIISSTLWKIGRLWFHLHIIFLELLFYVPHTKCYYSLTMTSFMLVTSTSLINTSWSSSEALHD